MEITPLGDSALIVHVRDRFEDAPDETLNEVLRVFHCIESAAIPGIIELAPAYTTVAIFFDPLQIVNTGTEPNEVFDWLAERVRTAIAGVAGPGRAATFSGRVVEIPVCYDSEFALDLGHVARHAKISAKEVVGLHSAAHYRVNCIGFTPGFPYLTGLPEKLATPRRPTPRKQVPAGSVAIGGAQTGIYPLRSPGGWNVVGRTPVRLFDPAKNPPTLLRTGDRVRFHPIAREEFEALIQ
jgi:inhibitor of KinA